MLTIKFKTESALERVIDKYKGYGSIEKRDHSALEGIVTTQTEVIVDIDNKKAHDGDLSRAMASEINQIDSVSFDDQSDAKATAAVAEVKRSILVIDDLIAQRSPDALLETLGLKGELDYFQIIAMITDKEELKQKMYTLSTFLKIDPDEGNFVDFPGNLLAYFQGSKHSIYLTKNGYQGVLSCVEEKVERKGNFMSKVISFPGLTSLRHLTATSTVKEPNSISKSRAQKGTSKSLYTRKK